MEATRTYTCAKCNNMEYEEKTVHMTGGWVSRMFDFQGNRFTAVICKRCGYTEFYRGSKSTWGNVGDALTGG